MTKGLFGGMTHYSHQSFPDIISDLTDECRRTAEFRDEIRKNVNSLEANGYWTTTVPSDFKYCVLNCLQHFDTVITEITDILNQIETEVEQHHITRLKRISQVAQEYNKDLGIVWHQKYDNQDYGNANFRIVERIYGDTRDMIVNLLDIDNMAGRLQDFVGRKKQKMEKNNPWTSGSFYVIVLLLILLALALMSIYVAWYAFPIVLIGGILMIGVIGGLQLRNDDKLSDATFLKLMSETYLRLPLLSSLRKKDDNEKDKS